MKIEVTKSMCGLGYGYLEGEEVDCPDAWGMEMVNLGYAALITTDSLPDDLPGRDALLKAGVKSLEEVKGITDLTEIEGIGQATSEKIKLYFAEKE